MRWYELSCDYAVYKKLKDCLEDYELLYFVNPISGGLVEVDIYCKPYIIPTLNRHLRVFYNNFEGKLIA